MALDAEAQAHTKTLPSRFTKRSAARISLGIVGLDEDGVETDAHATGWDEEDPDDQVSALVIKVESLELIINNMHLCIEDLKKDVQQEQHLRHASEQALREETSRSLTVITEQVALRAHLAMSNSARGNAFNVAHDIQQHSVPNSARGSASNADLFALRQEIHAILATVTKLENGAQPLAHQAAKQQIAMLWPEIQQQAETLVTEVKGRVQHLVRQSAEKEIKLLWPTLEKQAGCLQTSSSSFNEKAHQLLRLEENMEALRQRVDASERPYLRNKLPACLDRRGAANARKEGSVAS